MENRTTRKLTTSIDKLYDEVRKSNNRPDLPIRTQRYAASATIWSVFISTILTVFIFWYSCTTNTKIDGMSDLLLKQDTAIHKQDTAILKQDSMIGLQSLVLLKQDTSNQKQDSIIGSLTQLLAKQNSQLGLMTKQVLSLKLLVEKNQQLDSLGVEQNKRLENVLKQTRDVLEILNKYYTAAKRISYDEAYDAVHTMERYQPLFWPTPIPADTSNVNHMLSIAQSVRDTLEKFKHNLYLTFEPAVGAKWSEVKSLANELIKVIETKQLKYSVPGFDYPAARRKRIMELFEQFTNAYKDFLVSYGVNIIQD